MKNLTPEELSAALNIEIEVARRLLTTSAARARSPRRNRIQIAAAFAVLLLAGTVFANVRTQLAAFLARVNPPEPGEVVPRQLPYRGYLERDGVPVSGAQSLNFRLEYGDGGTAWPGETLIVPVSSGHFEVALGDSRTNQIPAAVFSDPSVLISVSVDGQALVGKQRLLTVPHASASATAHMCTTHEAIRSFELGLSPPMGWVKSGFGYLIPAQTQAEECVGWTT